MARSPMVVGWQPGWLSAFRPATIGRLSRRGEDCTTRGPRRRSRGGRRTAGDCGRCTGRSRPPPAAADPDPCGGRVRSTARQSLDLLEGVLVCQHVGFELPGLSESPMILKADPALVYGCHAPARLGFLGAWV